MTEAQPRSKDIVGEGILNLKGQLPEGPVLLYHYVKRTLKEKKILIGSLLDLPWVDLSSVNDHKFSFICTLKSVILDDLNLNEHGA